MNEPFRKQKEEDIPSPIARKMMAYLDCPCQVFPPMKEDKSLCTAYHAALEQAGEDSFYPVWVKADETLWECLVMNADPENECFDLETVRAYRRKLLDTQLPQGPSCLNAFLSERKEEMEEDGISWEEMLGEMRDGQAIHAFSSYWNFQSKNTDEMILAKIPAKAPWQIFAWLPMGSWNDCPGPEEMMAAAKYWYEAHGAIPACFSHDELEFYLERPVTDLEAAQKLALEHYAFCPDRVEQCEEDGSVGKLADSLTKSSVWYFWWD